MTQPDEIERVALGLTRSLRNAEYEIAKVIVEMDAAKITRGRRQALAAFGQVQKAVAALTSSTDADHKCPVRAEGGE